MSFSKRIAQSPRSNVATASDSDDEVFFGPVTDKEKQKASKLSRRTQVFFPPSWRPRLNNQLRAEQSNSPHLSKGISNNEETHLSGYTADVSKMDKSQRAVTEVDSLESAISADSLNEFSKDSLDMRADSLENPEQPESAREVPDRSDSPEELYDVGDYLPRSPTTPSPPPPTSDPVATPERRFTPLEMEELEKQLQSLAAEKRASSPELFDVSAASIPSPYDLDKQKLIYDSRIDSSTESALSPVKALLAKDRLDTVNEVSEPSSTDLESRLSSAHLSPAEKVTSTQSSAPRRFGSARSTPKQARPKTARTSTQLFEDLERQFEEEERLSSVQDPQTTYTILTQDDSLDNSRPHQSTYTVSSDTTSVHSFTYSSFPRENDTASRNEDSYEQMSDNCPDGEFNDTLEEYEMLMKYGVNYIYGKHHSYKKDEHCEEPSAKEAPHFEMRSAASDECMTRSSAQRKTDESTPLKRSTRTPLQSVSASKASSASNTPKVFHSGCVPQSEPSKVRRALSQRTAAPSPAPRMNQGSSRSSPPAHSNRKLVLPAESTTPGNPKFKVPTKIPQSAGRTPRSLNVVGLPMPSPRPSKFLSAVQSPIGAYIHNSPAPALLKNIKPKPCSSTVSREYERKQRPVWENVDALRDPKGESCENVNPNICHGLRVVHYTQAPCIKLDDPALRKPRLPRLGERFEKLLDSPRPQVIRHEGRVRVKPSSPQYTAAVRAVRSNLNDSAQNDSAAGDISVCVSSAAKRTNTLCQ